ncbi:protein ALTERED XYLOGLUCAN 9-like [Phragmites australis]|uniref:protein ALTERED XYLOGLUCAN 9-like n=1 Tax=Phragmites australis TaxID=29695 RepID=UPI002D7659A5|nr:protein ALTERED XYLOGLUCAN 9-like [Phragmites australis]
MVSAAAQVGVVAACVVLFVPMGLAGWHLSRNKVLFFSGALFVSLAVGVHLSPYLPSLPHLLAASFFPHPGASSNPSASPCVTFLHRVSWADAADGLGGGGGGGAGRSWSWPPTLASTCGFARLSRDEASLLLNGSWVMVAGDSQARLLVLALLRLLLDPVAAAATEPELFRRHSDYRTAVPSRGISVDFVWAPFESNLTRLLREDLRLAPRVPDVLVLGSGLWHMLHVTDAARYGDALASIAGATSSLRSPLPVPPPHMFWLGLPRLVNHMLNTDAKKAHMNGTMLRAYDREVDRRGVLRRDGGPFRLLDVGKLIQGCGQQCTADGMHYDGEVYDAVLHIMLNALVIESQQSI